MIKLTFKRNPETFGAIINEGKIWIAHPMIGLEQYLPQSPEAISRVVRKVKGSRNKIPVWFIDTFSSVPADEMEEFKKAQSDKELRDLVVRDFKKNQCELIGETNQ